MPLRSPRPALVRAIGALALVPTLALAQDALTARVNAAIQTATPDLIGVRQWLHTHPELGNREVETSKLIASKLKALGMEVRTGLSKTGVLGILRGGKPGPVVALRSDMDALPVTEASGYPTPSTVRSTYLGKEVGVAHACGHDIHMASLLLTATALASVKADLPGTVLFVFQPSEEGPPPGEEGGALVMLKEGLFGDPKPEAVFGLHTAPELPVGEVGWAPGPFFANGDGFEIVVHGRQSHGAQPHLSVDPIVVASQIVLGLQTIRSRNVPPLEASVVSVGIIRGGERGNIIPGDVTLSGTARSYTPEVRTLIETRMREIVQHTAAAYGATADFKFSRGDDAVVNDSLLARKAAAAVAGAIGAGNTKLVEPTMGAEDFSEYGKYAPAVFLKLGTTKPGTTSGGWHTPNFLADDSAIVVGAKIEAAVVLDYLRKPVRKSAS